MPKKTRYPGLRVHVRKGKNGQCWRSWYLDCRPAKDIPLGSDYAEAVRKWHEHKDGRSIVGIGAALNRWEREELPQKNRVTRIGYEKSLKELKRVFGGASWDGITMGTLKGYLRKRTAKTQGNREMALFSVIWRWAQTEDLTTLNWPAAGLSKSRWKNPEKARGVEVSGEDFAALYAHADPLLRDYLQLATSTGLRITDNIGVRLSDVRGTALVVKASKTGKLIEIDLTGSVLLDVIERRKSLKVPHVFLLAHGNRPVTERMIRDRFNKARKLAGLPHLITRDLRKFAAQISEDPQALLQHSNASVTKKHYLGRAKVKAAR
jgi:site-specific recombinase XerD